MKSLYFFTILLFSCELLFGQFDYVDQVDLYQQFGITQVNEIEIDSNKRVNTKKWTFTQNYLLSTHEMLPTDEDSLYSSSVYLYSDNKLNKEITIWNSSQGRIDTAITKYEYLNNKLIKTIRYSTNESDSTIANFAYQDNLLESISYVNPMGVNDMVDSLFYYEDSTIHIKKQTHLDYSFDSSYVGFERIQFFDPMGVINLEIEQFLDFSGSRLVPVNIVTYEADENKFYKETHFYLGTYELWGTQLTRRIIDYFYDERGLIHRVEYSHPTQEPYLVYEYSYN